MHAAAHRRYSALFVFPTILALLALSGASFASEMSPPTSAAAGDKGAAVAEQMVAAPRTAGAAMQPGTGAPQTVCVIPVEGFIDGGLFDSINRRVAEAQTLSPAIIVFEIDTYGGALTFAMEITDAIGQIESPKTVSYVPVKAYSAGAMIAMASREIVLTPFASIGDAAPVVESPEGGIQMLGEKVQSPTRNVFRKYAERNGYPIALAEAMVTPPESDISEVISNDGTKRYMSATDLEALSNAEKTEVKANRIVLKKGQLLTMTAAAAKDYGFAKYVVKDFDEMLAGYNLSGAKVVTFEVTWSESLVRFLNHPAVAGIIMLIGMLAVYMEFKMPGLGLPLFAGVICFAVFFFSKYLSGMAQYWEILIFLAGLALLMVEIFVIPGFGITGVVGLSMMFFGLVSVLVPKHITTAPMDVDFLFWTAVYTVGAMVAAIVIGALLTKLLPKTPVVGAFYLGAPRPGSVAHKAGAGVTAGRDLVGKTGVAITMLRPAGKGEIDGNVLDVTTQGDLVSKGTRIEVIAEKGNNIIVRQASGRLG